MYIDFYDKIKYNKYELLKNGIKRSKYSEI